ncbi:hypothetical protein HMSSN139_43460 [Paenibacillus sp. HMSSN-139]|nr:hypothetical protein HMSSN139_43460 [Paenibacillus sp. HMSSN-139]
MSTTAKLDAFRNEPFTDFRQESARQAMEAAIARVKSEELGREIPLKIGGRDIFTDAKIHSINPGNLDETIGWVSKADRELAEQAMQAALEAFESWKKSRPANARSTF